MVFFKNAGTIWPSHRQHEKGCTDKDVPLMETPMRVARKVKPEDLTIVEPMNVKPKNGSGASRTGGENEVVGDLGSEFLALVQ